MLSTYLEELWKWNRTYNLTAVKNPSKMVDVLIAESLAVSPFIPQGAKVMDFGSGAGIPGIPLKIERKDIILHLVERRAKKASFIRHVARKLGLSDVFVLERDLKGREKELLGKYDVVVSRAVMEPDKLFNMVRGYLKKGGLFLGYTTKDKASKAVVMNGRVVYLKAIPT